MSSNAAYETVRDIDREVRGKRRRATAEMFDALDGGDQVLKVRSDR